MGMAWVEEYTVSIIPQGEVFDRLYGLIKELAEKYYGPVFEPHVTLLGGIPLPEAEMRAKTEKLAGMVIDGGCRDVKQIRKIQFPVYARYQTPLAGGASKIFKTQIPVQCGGVSVSPGDIIFGDDDGIVVMKVSEINIVLDLAESIQKIEEKVMKKMETKTSLFLLMNFSDHYERISKGQDSKLEFVL